VKSRGSILVKTSPLKLRSRFRARDSSIGGHLKSPRWQFVTIVNEEFRDKSKTLSTAAEVFGPRVICVVLSGGDCDGVQGANAVAAAGGKCLVQEPQDAVVASMPISVTQRDHPMP